MTAPWWQTGAIYQIYPRSFQDTNGDGVGDVKGIERRLDYLVGLGVDAIWISPIYPSPMVDFGYDVADYRDVDPMFGTIEPDDSVRLVFNLSQGEDVRGPWNKAPDFDYIEDPEPEGGMPPAPVNPADEGHLAAKTRAKAR